MDPFGKNRATTTYVESAKEKEGTNLNDCFDVMSQSNIHGGNQGTNFVGYMDAFSPKYSHSNQCHGILSLGGSNHKAAMIDLVKNVYEKMNIWINNLTNIMKEGIALVGRQVEIAKKVSQFLRIANIGITVKKMHGRS